MDFALLSMVGGAGVRDERSFLNTDSNVDRYLAGLLPFLPTSLPTSTPLDDVEMRSYSAGLNLLCIFLMELLCS